jgi:phage baseplate assembly protein W
MSSYAPSLPITRDSADGFRVVRDFPTMVKQNLKMLLLTIPGERVMDPDYGVGLQTFLFEAFTGNTYSKMDDTIRTQVTLYMPYVNIEDIMFSAADQDSNILNVALKYSIPRIGAADLLEITI